MGQTFPAQDGAIITPNDTTTFRAARGIMVGVGGTVKLDFPSGITHTTPPLAAGIIHPIACTRIYATGTTATNIAVYY